MLNGSSGVAGCILGNMYKFDANMGSPEFVVNAFMVVILGGIGQLSGTVLAGILVGTSNVMLVKLFGFTEMLAKVAVLFAVVAVILYRPAGLFTTRERVYD